MSAPIPEVFAAMLILPADIPHELKLEIASEFYCAPHPMQRIHLEEEV